MGWGKKNQRKKDVTQRAGKRVHTDFWIENARLFPELFPKQ